jgi:RNA polymerase sigma-70 factor (ECF subfamily)
VEERELIGRVLAGDPSAERALYDAHVDRVFRLTYRMVRDFRGEAALSTWLGSIAISVTLNGLRKVRRQTEREVALDDAAPVGRGSREAEPDLKERLNQAIDRLPDGYRAVFVMHDVEGYTHEEIATSLGVHPGTSKAQLFRARARLREALADFVRD